MKNYILLFTLILSLLFLFNFNLISLKKDNKSNYVPDSATAIKVAEAIWLPIYGKEIYKQKPFKAILLGGNVWQVSGTLKTQKGGVAYIELQKSDCKVLSVYHTK